jgi:hypothetical protein
MTSTEHTRTANAPSVQGLQTASTSADAAPFLIDGATQADPSDILGSVTQSGDDITLITDAVGISNFPDTAISWERPLESIFGTPSVCELGDIFRAIGRANGLVPPVDLHFGMSIESADAGRGVAWRIAAVAGQWQVQHTAKTDGTWSDWRVGASQSTTQAFEGQLVAGTGNVQARISNAGLDALGVSTGGAGNTSPTSNNVGPELARLKVFVGYVTGSGGITGAFTFKASHILAKRLEWPTLARSFSVAPAQVDRATQPTTFVIAGQSNADGVAHDQHDGESLLPGTFINDRGVDLTLMPDGEGLPNEKRYCGPLPYLDKYARLAGATTVNILRLAADGQSITACLADFPIIVSRLAAKGWMPEYWYFAQGEASTTLDASTPAAEYYERLTHYVELILTTFPDCRVGIQSLPMHTTDYGGPGNSASYPIVEAAQRQVCDEHPDRVLLVDSRGTPRDPRQVPLSHDEVHLAVDDGGGFDVMMARFREVWACPEAELVQSDVCSDPDLVMLHDDSHWLGTLHVSPAASAEMLALALDAERILLAMCGDAIARDATPGGPGILLGLFAEWEREAFGFTDGVPDYVLMQGHEYIVVSAGERVLILGRTDRATAYAFYRFTELLRHRQLLPTAAWEVIEPHVRISVRLAIGETSILDFLATLGASGGLGEDAGNRLDAWRLKNRIPVGGYVFGHAYGQIVKANPDPFAANPQWLSPGNKFCVLESGLRDVVFDWVMNEITTNPDRVVQTLAAADGSLGWDAVCTGTDEQATYSPSDRQLMLANEMQGRIAATGVRLSIQAYGRTSPTPTEPVDPRIVVAVTDGYFENGMTWQEVADGYRTQGASDIIPYAYTAVWPFDVGIPGSGRASDLSLMAIDAARAVESPGTLHGLIAEGCAGWAPWGLGYWVLAKLCTDRTTTTDAGVLRQTFLDSAFGQQSPILSNFYAILETTAPLTEDRLHRMYQWLADALADGPTAAVRARIYELAVYTRYLELLLCWKRDETIGSFDEMVAWLWRSRDMDLLPVRLSYTQPTSWQTWYVRLEALYPTYTFGWFSPKPYSGAWALQDQSFGDAELDTVIANGIVDNELFPFEQVVYSEDLVFVARPPDARHRGEFIYSHRNHSFHLFMRAGQTTWSVEHRAGFVTDTDGNAYLNVVEISSGEVVARVEALVNVATTSQVLLRENTLYRVDVDPNSGVHWSCPGFCTTKLTNLERSMYQGPFSGYFLVPAGTTEIGGYANDDVRFESPAGALIHTTLAPDYFVFAIDPPLADEIWKFENANAVFCLMTVPPGIAFSPDELLVPAELVRLADAAPSDASRSNRPELPVQRKKRQRAEPRGSERDGVTLTVA